MRQSLGVALLRRVQAGPLPAQGPVRVFIAVDTARDMIEASRVLQFVGEYEPGLSP